MSVIQIDEKTAAALRAMAHARNLSLDSLLQGIAADAAPISKPAALTPEEMERLLEEASAGSPVLPDIFSREDIYFDHD